MLCRLDRTSVLDQPCSGLERAVWVPAGAPAGGGGADKVGSPGGPAA